MIRLDPSMRYTDIEQWIGRGWCFIMPHDGTFNVAQCVRFPMDDEVDEEHECYWHFEDMQGGYYEWTFEECLERVRPHWPTCGSINVPPIKAAVHLERLQMKQWRRTYNARQLTMHFPRKWDYTGRTGKAWDSIGPDHSHVIDAAFDPWYPQIDEIDELFAAGWHSLALTPHIIITNTMPRLVYYGGACAAKVTETGFEPIDSRLTGMVAKQLPGGMYA